jgi:hypothetical protein
MSETWYRTVSWGTRIDTVEILSHTDKTVTIKYGANGTHRRNLRSSFENYFATWEEGVAIPSFEGNARCRYRTGSAKGSTGASRKSSGNEGWREPMSSESAKPEPPNCADILSVSGINDGKSRAIIAHGAITIARAALKGTQ